MFFLARKNLFADRTRLTMSIGGVAFSVLLILIIGGLYRGWQTKLTLYLDSLDTDLWVGQAGSADTSHSMSFLPATLATELERVPGISRVDEFMGRQIMVTDKGKEYRLFLVGFDPTAGRNGPLEMVDGTSNISDGQIIIDRAFADKAGYAIGDVVPLADKRLTVAGISAGGNSLIYQYAYVTKNDVRAILQLGPLVNYFLVNASVPDAARTAIQQRYPELNVMTKEEFSVNNKKVVTEVFLPIVGVLLVIAFFIGSVIVGLTIYTATIEKSREYGVLKAIGGSNPLLYRVVIEQSFIAGVVGFLVGLALSFILGYLANRFVSGFITSIGWVEMLGAFGIAMLMSIVAAWIPARRIATIDPALVFKS